MKAKTIFIVVLLAGFVIHAQAQVSEKESVLKTARAQISNFIKDLPDENLTDYGFLNRAELSKIDFGDPIPVYTVKDSVVFFTATWRVPVLVNREYRSLLTVTKENGSFAAVDFGATELAKAYAANKTPKTIGILRVYEMKTDFLMEEPESGKQVFKPLEFNR